MCGLGSCRPVVNWDDIHKLRSTSETTDQVWHEQNEICTNRICSFQNWKKRILQFHSSNITNKFSQLQLHLAPTPLQLTSPRVPRLLRDRDEDSTVITQCLLWSNDCLSQRFDIHFLFEISTVPCNFTASIVQHKCPSPLNSCIYDGKALPSRSKFQVDSRLVWGLSFSSYGLGRPEISISCQISSYV